MIRHPPAQLLRLDRRIDRCPQCGAWRWNQHCTTCQPTEQEEASKWAFNG